jgi:hypothetical protein
MYMTWPMTAESDFSMNVERTYYEVQANKLCESF